MNPHTCCLFLLTLVLVPAISYAQPPEYVRDGFRVSRVLYHNTLGERGATEFRYDANGRIVHAWWELTDRSKHSTNTYQYNHRGQLVSVFREFSDTITSFEVFTYDERGNRIAERFCRSDRVRGTATYHYDGSDRRLRATFQRHKGWLDGEAMFQYDDRGVVTGGVLMDDADTTARISYLYDTHGNLATEEWHFAQGWSQTFTYEYVPAACKAWCIPDPLVSNSCQFRVVREEYMFNDTLGGPSVYVYGAGGNLLTKTFTRSDGLKTVTSYVHDPSRRLLRSIRRGADGAEHIFLFDYDQGGRLILKTQKAGDIPISTTAYYYDGQGRVIRQVLHNVDGWLTGVLSFDHDSRGRVQRGHFRGHGAVAADVTYEYNNDDCLSSVDWQFASGTTQKYRFLYEPRAPR
jgi:YD repeat-containing protein